MLESSRLSLRNLRHWPMVGLLALGFLPGCTPSFPDNSANEPMGESLILGAWISANRWLTFNPSSIGGLRFWIRAENIQQSNGTSVTSWADLSGTGNTVVAGTAPIFFSSTNTINSRPVVRFTGTAVLTNAAPVGLTSSDSGSIFAVLRSNQASADILIIGGCGNTARQFQFSTTTISPTKTCVGQAINPAYSWPIGAMHEVAWIQNLATYVEVRADGRLVASGVPAVSGYGTGALNVSNSTASGMDLAELLWFDSALTTQNITSVECYLGARYGTTTCL